MYKTDDIYFYSIGLFSTLLASYYVYIYFFKINSYDLNLSNNTELLEYCDNYLSSYFIVNSASEIAAKFIFDKELFNMLRNVDKIIVKSSLYANLDFKEILQLQSLFSKIENCSDFKDYNKSKINREEIFIIIKSLRSNIFGLDY